MHRPNILLILADELRADALGCYGNTLCRTPELDLLAGRGARFEQCMVTQPTCTPSRASILTGCWPSALRSRMVGCVTPDDPRFLPRVLSAAGYRTGSVGKIHLAPAVREADALALTRRADGRFEYYGFQEVDLVCGHGMHCFGPGYTAWLAQQAPDWQARLAASRPLVPGVNNATGSLRTQEWTLPAGAHSGEYIAERSARFLREAAGAPERPFFLHVSFPDPHHPFTVPEPFASLYRPGAVRLPLPAVDRDPGATALQLQTYRGANSEFVPGQVSDRLIGTPPADYRQYTAADWQAARAVYYGMVTQLDGQIGRILRTLEETGLDRTTVVVFLADHGDYLGDHGLGGKGFHYDSVIRAPLLVSGPGVRAGTRLDGVASTLDLAPTLLELAGVPEPEGMQGVSMRQALTGDGALPRTAVLTENDDDFVPMRARTLTTRDWKLTWYCGEQDGELYDRRTDPDELCNRWSDPDCGAAKARLLDRLLEEVVCAVDPSNGRRQAPAPPGRKWLAASGRIPAEDRGEPGERP